MPLLYLKKGHYPVYPLYNMGDGFVRCKVAGVKRKKFEFHFTQLRLDNNGSVRDFIEALPSIEKTRESTYLEAQYLYGDLLTYDRMVEEYNKKWNENQRSSKGIYDAMRYTEGLLK